MKPTLAGLSPIRALSRKVHGFAYKWNDIPFVRKHPPFGKGR